MIAPHDRNTIAEVNKIRNASDIKFKGNKELIEIIGKEETIRRMEKALSTL